MNIQVGTVLQALLTLAQIAAGLFIKNPTTKTTVMTVLGGSQVGTLVKAFNNNPDGTPATTAYVPPTKN